MTISFLTPIIAEYNAKLEAAVEAQIEDICARLRGAIPGSPVPSGYDPERDQRAARATKTRPGQKRSPEHLEWLTKHLLAHVKRHPGQNIEQISDATGESSKALILPMKKLLADKSISTKGQKRGTRYFPR